MLTNHKNQYKKQCSTFLTKSSLLSQMSCSKYNVSVTKHSLGMEALRVAEKELEKGAREIGGNNSGAFVEKYLKPAGLRPPQPWCAAFVSWCIAVAAKKVKKPSPIPYTASARRLLYAAIRAGLITHDPQPGDLVVWSRGSPSGPFGHIGIVVKRIGDEIETIEGNREPKVAIFKYRLGKMPRLLGFIRIP